jgi:NAD(P)-dependent dehydrogenase (short-subunit alcohol dehydrogenase family)
LIVPQTILVTGCSSGIGRALAEEFARRGHSVYATARRIESLADLQHEKIRHIALDVTDEGSICNAVTQVMEQSGGIDMLVNNAGYGQMGPLLDTKPEHLRKQLETNVVGQMTLSNAIAPHMIEKGRGVIVNVSSISGIMVTPFAGAYCASKAAFTALSEAMRMELAPFGVKVMIVQPGGVRSKFGDNAASQLALAEDSRYRPIEKGIHARANASQQQAMPAEEVARDIADAALREDPPFILRTGTGGNKYPAYKRWMPVRRLDRMLMKRFGLDRLQP